MPRDPELREKPAPDRARSIARQTGIKAGVDTIILDTGFHVCRARSAELIAVRVERAPAWHLNGSVLAHSATPTAGCRVHPTQH